MAAISETLRSCAEINDRFPCRWDRRLACPGPARKVYELNIQAFKVGVAKSTDLESLYLWSVRWLIAERDLSDTPADRVAAAEAHLKRMKSVEAMANAFAKIEPAGGRYASAAEFYRVQAQVWLTQAKGK